MAAVFALGSAGCAQSIGPYRVEQVMQAASAESAPVVVSRTIPLRMVALVKCQKCRDRECARSCNHVPPDAYLFDAARAANETFAPAHVQFELHAVERVEAPEWWRHGPQAAKKTWREIEPEARRLFPWMPARTWGDPGETKQVDNWLEVIAAVYARPQEITVFVQSGNTHAGTHFPNGGRAIWASDGTFGTGPESSFRYLFAHELGHYLGLRHTFAHAGTNPITGGPWRLSDRWDLVYRPGSGPDDAHEFFSSREDAARYPDSQLRLIERWDRQEKSSCHDLPDGAIECVMPGKNGYSETHQSGEEVLKGLSMPLGPNESRRYRWARNAMAYGPMDIPRRLSASQIQIVQIFLQHPLMVGNDARNRWGRLPDGMDAIPSYRTTLGVP